MKGTSENIAQKLSLTRESLRRNNSNNKVKKKREKMLATKCTWLFQLRMPLFNFNTVSIAIEHLSVENFQVEKFFFHVNQ